MTTTNSAKLIINYAIYAKHTKIIRTSAKYNKRCILAGALCVN